jgi:hypothetical protein
MNEGADRVALSKAASWVSVQDMVEGVAIGASDGRFEAVIHTGAAARTAHNDCPSRSPFQHDISTRPESFEILQQVADMDLIAAGYWQDPRAAAKADKVGHRCHLSQG